MLPPNQWRWGGEGHIFGGLGAHMLWEGKVLQELYGTKLESDLTKTQNSQGNNEQKNLL